jgi:mRNA interferase MazF
MPTFEAGEIVKVPFPYTDREVRQRRPALVISREPLGDGRLYWVLMITSADHRRWPGDVALGKRHGEAGLPAPSVIRTSKVATVEQDRMEPLGRLPRSYMDAVDAELDRTLSRGG